MKDTVPSIQKMRKSLQNEVLALFKGTKADYSQTAMKDR